MFLHLKGTCSDMISHTYMLVTYTHPHTQGWVSLGFFFKLVPVLLFIAPGGAAHSGVSVVAVGGVLTMPIATIHTGLYC